MGDGPNSLIGFGSMRLTGEGIWGPPSDPRAAVDLLLLAYDLGVRVIDTAWYYGPDVTNELIARAFPRYPDDLLIVTKVGNSRTKDRSWAPALSPSELRVACERDLQALCVSELQLVLLRWHTSIDRQERFEDALGTMLDMQSEGKIRRIGLSNVSPTQLEVALSMTKVAAVSNGLSLNNRRDLATVRRCTEIDILYLPYYPLLAGSLLRHPVLQHVSMACGITPAQFALAWLCAQSPCVVPIPGTADVLHLRENIAAQEMELPNSLLKDVEARIPGDSLS